MVLSGKTKEAVRDKKREAAFTTENCNYIASTFAFGKLGTSQKKQIKCLVRFVSSSQQAAESQ